MPPTQMYEICCLVYVLYLRVVVVQSRERALKVDG